MPIAPRAPSRNAPSDIDHACDCTQYYWAPATLATPTLRDAPMSSAVAGGGSPNAADLESPAVRCGSSVVRRRDAHIGQPSGTSLARCDARLVGGGPLHRVVVICTSRPTRCHERRRTSRRGPSNVGASWSGRCCERWKRVRASGFWVQSRAIWIVETAMPDLTLP